MRSTEVIGRDGLHGELTGPIPGDPRSRVEVRLDDGQIVEIPASLLKSHESGGYEIPLSSRDVRSPWREPAQQHAENVNETVVPVIAEELDVHKRVASTGGIRVHRRLLEHDEDIETTLRREHLDIRRVIINEEVEGPLPVRREGETIIVPIVEEVLIVEKRYRLKEEVHMIRRVVQEPHRERVVVRRQEPEIEEIGPDGRSRGFLRDKHDGDPRPRR